MKSLFWNVDFSQLDVKRDADLILSRVLGRGRLRDVRWVIRRYGEDRLRRFFQERARPELSPRVRNFWRVALRAEEEEWPEPPAFRQASSVHWSA
jgi:hypothetical protein